MGLGLFISIMIGAMLFGLISHLLTKLADNVGLLPRIFLVIFVQFGLPIVFLIVVLGGMIIEHDSKIP